MKKYLIEKFIAWLFKDFDLASKKKFTEAQKIKSFKDAAEVENFVDILKGQEQTTLRHIALRCKTNDEIQFYRGALFGLTSVTLGLQKSKERWLLMQKKLNPYAKEKTSREEEKS